MVFLSVLASPAKKQTKSVGVANDGLHVLVGSLVGWLVGWLVRWFHLADPKA
jgi:hypothetical protein